jgi:hypothetical protein
MRFADWQTFKNMRLVCKQWHAWSNWSIQHWYNWLCEWGPRDKWELIDHDRLYNCAGVDCRIKYHYRTVKHPPKILKTMALCDQVFRLGAEKQLKRLEQQLNFYYSRVADLGRQLKVAENNYRFYVNAKMDSERAAELLLDRLATRKRRRISKPT